MYAIFPESIVVRLNELAHQIDQIWAWLINNYVSISDVLDQINELVITYTTGLIKERPYPSRPNYNIAFTKVETKPKVTFRNMPYQRRIF